MIAPRLTIYTCSYAPDHDRCKRLCDSLDRFTEDEVEHIVVVPKRDLRLFSDVGHSRRRILAVEEVVPGNIIQLPFSNKRWLLNGWRPVRGWIMQQVAKMSAARVARSEYLLFADSDLQLIKPVNSGRFVRDDKLRLHAQKGALDYGFHLRWHYVASRLLGLPEEYAGYNYNGQLISWRKGHLEALTKRLQDVNGKPWADVIASVRTVSEYILFGHFVERVAKVVGSEYYHADEGIVHSCWTREELERFAKSREDIPEQVVALHIQSNLGLSTAEEEAIIAKALS